MVFSNAVPEGGKGPADKFWLKYGPDNSPLVAEVGPRAVAVDLDLNIAIK